MAGISSKSTRSLRHGPWRASARCDGRGPRRSGKRDGPVQDLEAEATALHIPPPQAGLFTSRGAQ
eukprot:3361647-Alexandrium_andersonii.AAC.1